MSELPTTPEELLEFLQLIYEYLILGVSFAELGWGGILLIGTVITSIVSAICSLILFILESIPLFAISRKLGRKWAWLAWIPVGSSYFRIFVLADMAGDKPLRFFNNKVTIRKRSTSFWIYLGITLCGNALITVAVGVLNMIPGLGQVLGLVTALLYLLPSAVAGIMEYAYLRDVLNIFKEDRSSNRTVSIVVTVLDALATNGLARAILFYTLLKKQPLPAAEEEPIPESRFTI